MPDVRRVPGATDGLWSVSVNVRTPVGEQRARHRLHLVERAGLRRQHDLVQRAAAAQDAGRSQPAQHAALRRRDAAAGRARRANPAKPSVHGTSSRRRSVPKKNGRASNASKLGPDAGAIVHQRIDADVDVEAEPLQNAHASSGPARSARPCRSAGARRGAPRSRRSAVPQLAPLPASGPRLHAKLFGAAHLFGERRRDPRMQVRAHLARGRTRPAHGSPRRPRAWSPPDSRSRRSAARLKRSITPCRSVQRRDRRHARARARERRMPVELLFGVDDHEQCRTRVRAEPSPARTPSSGSAGVSGRGRPHSTKLVDYEVSHVTDARHPARLSYSGFAG